MRITAGPSIAFGLAAALALPALAAAGTPSSDPLADTRWHIVEIGGRAVSGPRFTLAFSADRVSGRAGCNSFSGAYRRSGRTISVGPMMMTRMACANVNGPAGVDPMAMERRVTEILSGPARISRSGDDEMTLAGRGGAIRLRRAD